MSLWLILYIPLAMLLALFTASWLNSELANWVLLALVFYYPALVVTLAFVPNRWVSRPGADR